MKKGRSTKKSDSIATEAIGASVPSAPDVEPKIKLKGKNNNTLQKDEKEKSRNSTINERFKSQDSVTSGKRGRQFTKVGVPKLNVQSPTTSPTKIKQKGKLTQPASKMANTLKPVDRAKDQFLLPKTSHVNSSIDVDPRSIQSSNNKFNHLMPSRNYNDESQDERGRESRASRTSIFRDPEADAQAKREFNQIDLNELPSFRGENPRPVKNIRASMESEKPGVGSTWTKWHKEKDTMYIYQMDKLFKFNEVSKMEIYEMVEWKKNDIKGQKKTQYIKMITNANDQVMKVADLDELELLVGFEDRWPCLNFRKKVKRIKIIIVMACEKIIAHRLFEATSITIILLNCVTLAMEDPTKDEETAADKIWENTFQGLYTVEMLFKIIGMGLIWNDKGDDKAYLRDPFNILDFVIIMSAYLTMATPLIESMMGEAEEVKAYDEEEEGLSLSSLRAFRVLRPLRAVTSIQGLKILVQSVITSLPFLKHTMVVLMFFFLIFAIAGVNLFSGMLKQRCVNFETGRQLDMGDEEELICGGDTVCPEGYFCGKMNVNPNNEVTNFDNIFWALLVVFQCVTLEGWSDVQQYYQQAYTYYVFLYFVPLVFMGAFFLLNLVLAVINNSFSENQKKYQEEQEKIAAEKNKLKKTKTDDDEQLKQDDGEDKDLHSFGVAEFFIAKKAAAKMIHWYHKERDEKQRRDDELADLLKKARGEQEKEDQLKEDAKLKARQAIAAPKTNQTDAHSDSQTSFMNKFKQRLTPQRQTEQDKNGSLQTSPQPIKKQTSLVSKSEEQNESQSNINSVISEEQEESESASEPDPHDKRVADFLKELNEDIGSENKFNSLASQDAKIIQPGKILDEYNFEQIKHGQLQVEPAQHGRMIGTSIGFKSRSRAFEMALIEDKRATPEIEEKRKTINTAGMLQSGSNWKARKNKKKKYDLIDEFDEQNDSIGIFENESLVNQQFALENFIGPEDLNIEGLPNISLHTQRQNVIVPQDSNDYFDFHPYEMEMDFHGKQDPAFVSEGQGLKSLLDSAEKSSIINSDILSSDASKFGFLKSGANVAPMWNTKGFEEPKTKLRGNKNFHSRKSSVSPTRAWKTRYEDEDTLRQGTPARSQTNRPGMLKAAKTMKVVGQRRGTMLRFQNQKPNQTLDSTVVGYESQMNINQTNNEKAEIKTTKVAQGDDDYAKEKKKMVSMYENTPLEDFKVKPEIMFTYDKKENLKIRSNPHQQYYSTSQNEVFEIRDRDKERTGVKQVNQFIAVQEEQGSDCDSSDYEIADVKPVWEPYQLKNWYLPVEKTEFVLDDDDEDFLLFMPQPFDTLMSIGYSDLLTQLPTKFLARRSDIIVSSTLSITLTPIEEKFVPLKKALMTNEQVKNWIDKRQKFRCQYQVELAMLPNKNKFADKTMTDLQSSVYTEEYKAADGATSPNQSVQNQSPRSPRGLSPRPSEASEGKNSDGIPQDSDRMGMSVSDLVPNNGKKRDQTGKAKIVPLNLLEEPLPEKEITKMSNAERRDYRQWLERFNTANGRKEKMVKSSEDPKLKKFTLQEANLLLKGEFHEEVEENKGEGVLNDKANRSVFVGNRESIQNELNIAQYEEAINKVINQEVQDLTELQAGDCIPQHIRTEFSLPNAQEMEGYSIDFNEVRLKDASLKKRISFWSGQDVLDLSLQNKAMSNWVIKHLNRVRIWPLFIFGFVKKARCLLKMLTRTTLFDQFMTQSVLVNTVVMAMDKYGIDKGLEAQLEEINTVFTWIFIVEMSCKLLAIGPAKYCAEPMNILDGAVVTLSIIEIVMTATGGGAGGGSLQAFRTIRVFRTFRVLRVTRLLRALQQMQVIVRVMQSSFMSFVYITSLLFIFVFIYSLLGMQFFGGLYDFDDGVPRGNFDTFPISFITVFQVLTMENWQINLFDSMRSSAPKPVTAMFYISWIFIGNIVLLNLFLAILLDAFISENEATETTDEDLELERIVEEKQKEMVQEIKALRREKIAKANRAPGRSQSNIGGDVSLKDEEPKKKKKKKVLFSGQAGLAEIDDIEDLGPKEIKKFLEDEKLIKIDQTNWQWKSLDSKIQCQKSLYLFEKHTSFRRLMYNIQKHKFFDQFIMLLIFLSSMKLATDTYMTEDDYDKEDTIMVVSEQLNNFFTWVFAAESLVKILALGFIMDEESYLREGWSQLDFFIVVTSLIDFSLQGADIKAIKILRLLRTFRPLRVISHNKSLRLIVTALFGSMSAIFQVSIVVLVVWLMFGIFGISTYKGSFFRCTVDQYYYHDLQSCEEVGGTWKVWDSNFDDIGQAMLTLFIVSSLEGWPDIMYQSLDVVGLDKGPLLENSVVNSIFFILFILIGSFFFLNFFIGVLFLKYTQADKAEKKGFTEEHLDWIELQTMILKAKCPHDIANKPQRGLRRKAWYIVTPPPWGTSQIFDMSIMSAIVLNMFQMALIYEGCSEEWQAFLDITNYIFSAIFVLEAILKLFVYRLAYFGTAWNKFDFFVVVSSLFDIGMKFLPQGGDNQILQVVPQLARVFRVLRVSRVLRLAGKMPELQTLLQTIERAVSSIMNVFLLLMLIFFMFATLGVFFFSGITEGNIINPGFKNFTRFGDGFLLLFAIATGEAWNEIMYDCYLGEGGSPFAPAYYITFIMLVTHVMLNLFILVIIEQFERFYLKKNSPVNQFTGTLEKYQECWEKFAIPAKHCSVIREKDLFVLFTKLRPPLGCLLGTNEDKMKKKILRMDIKSENGYIQFNELLYRLMRDEYGGQNGLVFKLTQKMQIREIITQFKLYKLCQQQYEQFGINPKAKVEKEPAITNKNTLSNIRSGKISLPSWEQKKPKEEKGLMFLGAKEERGVNSVNPFLTRMFFRITFSSWKNVYRALEKKKRKNKDQAFVDSNFVLTMDEDDISEDRKVTITLNPVEMEYTSEESEAEGIMSGSAITSNPKRDLKNSRARLINLDANNQPILAPTDGEESLSEEQEAVIWSPELHRATAKQIKETARRRLRSLDVFSVTSPTVLKMKLKTGYISPTMSPNASALSSQHPEYIHQNKMEQTYERKVESKKNPTEYSLPETKLIPQSSIATEDIYASKKKAWDKGDYSGIDKGAIQIQKTPIEKISQRRASPPHIKNRDIIR